MSQWNRTLLEAADAGNTAKSQQTLEKGANLNATDKDGWPPLHLAAFNGRKDTAECLVFNGARLDTENSFGKTALDVADNDEIRSILTAARWRCQ